MKEKKRKMRWEEEVLREWTKRVEGKDVEEMEVELIPNFPSISNPEML